MTKKKKGFSEFVEQDQIALSSTTIELAHWLVEHGQEELKQLLFIAYEKTQKRPEHKLKTSDLLEFNETVIQLLGLIELLAQEIVDENQTQDLYTRMLIPTLKRLDGDAFQKNLIDVSAHKALKRSKARQENPREVLFQELLRRWKPSKRTQGH